MSRFKMMTTLMFVACLSVPLACDQNEASEAEQAARSLTVQCADPAGGTPVRLDAELVSESAMERRISEAQNDLSSYECWSPELEAEASAFEAPASSSVTDLTAPRREAVALLVCIPVCCSGKAICVPADPK